MLEQMQLEMEEQRVAQEFKQKQQDLILQQLLWEQKFLSQFESTPAFVGRSRRHSDEFLDSLYAPSTPAESKIFFESNNPVFVAPSEAAAQLPTVSMASSYQRLLGSGSSFEAAPPFETVASSYRLVGSDLDKSVAVATATVSQPTTTTRRIAEEEAFSGHDSYFSTPSPVTSKHRSRVQFSSSDEEEDEKAKEEEPVTLPKLTLVPVEKPAAAAYQLYGDSAVPMAPTRVPPGKQTEDDDDNDDDEDYSMSSSVREFDGKFSDNDEEITVFQREKSNRALAMEAQENEALALKDARRRSLREDGRIIPIDREAEDNEALALRDALKRKRMVEGKDLTVFQQEENGTEPLLRVSFVVEPTVYVGAHDEDLVVEGLHLQDEVVVVAPVPTLPPKGKLAKPQVPLPPTLPRLASGPPNSFPPPVLPGLAGKSVVLSPPVNNNKKNRNMHEAFDDDEEYLFEQHTMLRIPSETAIILEPKSSILLKSNSFAPDFKVVRDSNTLLKRVSFSERHVKPDLQKERQAKEIAELRTIGKVKDLKSKFTPPPPVIKTTSLLFRGGKQSSSNEDKPRSGIFGRLFGSSTPVNKPVMEELVIVEPDPIPEENEDSQGGSSRRLSSRQSVDPGEALWVEREDDETGETYWQDADTGAFTFEYPTNGTFTSEDVLASAGRVIPKRQSVAMDFTNGGFQSAAATPPVPAPIPAAGFTKNKVSFDEDALAKPVKTRLLSVSSNEPAVSLPPPLPPVVVAAAPTPFEQDLTRAASARALNASVVVVAQPTPFEKDLTRAASARSMSSSAATPPPSGPFVPAPGSFDDSLAKATRARGPSNAPPPPLPPPPSSFINLFS